MYSIYNVCIPLNAMSQHLTLPKVPTPANYPNRECGKPNKRRSCMNGESDRVKPLGEDNDGMQGGVAHKCACRITPFGQGVERQYRMSHSKQTAPRGNSHSKTAQTHGRPYSAHSSVPKAITAGGLCVSSIPWYHPFLRHSVIIS